MSDRWSAADKNVYGAEDDEDMDAILDALDRAVEADQPTDHASKP